MLGAKPEDEYETYLGGMGMALITQSVPPEMQRRMDQAHSKRTKYQDVSGYIHVTPKQCLDYLASNVLPQEDEIALRVYAWHLTNDRRTKGGEQQLDESESQNLLALLSHLDIYDLNKVLIRAEILRELGRFEEAALALDHDVPNDMAALAEQIMQAIERKDSAPFMFAPGNRDGDIQFTWAWLSRRHRPEIPEEPQTPLDPPVFHISNRDWWVKVLGMLQHNWALLEPHSDGTATVFFFHDQGSSFNDTGYKHHQIKDRAAICDSLDFVSVAAARRALHRNGFDRLKDYPGPWVGCEPSGHFYDARDTEKGVYSKQGHWLP